MNTNLFVNTNVPFCSRWACGSRNLMKLGNGLLLSCPRPPPDGQALSTKTLEVTSRKSRKKLLVSFDICHLFVGAAQDASLDAAVRALARHGAARDVQVRVGQGALGAAAVIIEPRRPDQEPQETRMCKPCSSSCASPDIRSMSTLSNSKSKISRFSR